MRFIVRPAVRSGNSEGFLLAYTRYFEAKEYSGTFDFRHIIVFAKKILSPTL